MSTFSAYNDELSNVDIVKKDYNNVQASYQREVTTLKTIFEQCLPGILKGDVYRMQTGDDKSVSIVTYIYIYNINTNVTPNTYKINEVVVWTDNGALTHLTAQTKTVNASYFNKQCEITTVGPSDIANEFRFDNLFPVFLGGKS